MARSGLPVQIDKSGKVKKYQSHQAVPLLRRFNVGTV